MFHDFEDNANCGCAIELPNYELKNDVRPRGEDEEKLIKAFEDLVAMRGMKFVLARSEYLAYEFSQYFEKV